MTEGLASGRTAQLREDVAAPLAAAAALWDQRGKLRLIGEVAPMFPRVVATGAGASFAVARSLAVALRGAGVESVSLPVDALAREMNAFLDGRSLLVCVGRSGDATQLVSLLSSLSVLPAMPFTVAVTAIGGSGVAELADVTITADVPPDAGPPLRVPLVTAVMLSAVAELLLMGAHAHIDAILSATDDVAARAVDVATKLVVMPHERETSLAAQLAGRSSLLVLGRGAGRAAAELAGLAWLTNAGRAVHVADAGEMGLGAIEAAGPDLAALVLSPGHATSDADRRVATDLAAAGTAVVFVAPAREAPQGIEHVVVDEVHPVVDPVLSALVATVVGRRVAADRGRTVGRLVRADPAALA